MNRFSIVSLSACLLGAAASADDATLRGFKPENSVKQREWEGKFRAIPDADRLRESMRLLSARPHHVGSAYGKQNAEWILARFKEYGWDAQIETFNVLFPTPKERLLEMVEPKRFVATLDEPALAIDPTSGQKTEQLPTYNSYSVDGDVTAPLVYVNYGLPDDYERLEASRHLRQGRHRDRAVRQLMARHQAQGGGRARRGRLHHLLGSERRRLLRR